MVPPHITDKSTYMNTATMFANLIILPSASSPPPWRRKAVAIMRWWNDTMYNATIRWYCSESIHRATVVEVGEDVYVDVSPTYGSTWQQRHHLDVQLPISPCCKLKSGERQSVSCINWITLKRCTPIKNTTKTANNRKTYLLTFDRGIALCDVNQASGRMRVWNEIIFVQQNIKNTILAHLDVNLKSNRCVKKKRLTIHHSRFYYRYGASCVHIWHPPAPSFIKGNDDGKVKHLNINTIHRDIGVK